MTNQLQTVHDKLEKIACLGNGDTHGNSIGNTLAIECLEIVKQMMQAEPVAYAKSISDELMNCVDRLGSEYDQVDPRVWKHLLVYAPQAVPAEPSCPDCHAPHLLYECVHCSASNYPAAPVVKESDMEPHDQNWIHGEDV